ncbi:MAG: 50S ribosomal protein L11 methyltransferase [Clostridia bacterium]|nr:50S ribosomal protein L11 methyltransferase [Clostridia bacterium]
MKYVEFTVHTTDLGEELVSDILWKYQNYGVAVCSVKDVIELTENRRETFDYIDEGLFDFQEGISLVKSYYDIDKADDIKRLIMQDFELLKLNAQGNINIGSLELLERIVDGDDWIEIWRKHYRPIHFGKITICPRWLEPNTTNQVVYIDSNAAFGTGEHETTSMCLEYLQNNIKEGQVVVDVGTGSGILGLCAAKLGAKKVFMTDNDQVAVDAAKHNAEINNVSQICTVVNTDLLTDVEIKGDIVVANITADVLRILGTTIKEYLKENSIVILSGILKSRLTEIIDYYTDLGLKLVDSKVQGEWSAVVMSH